MNYVTQRLLTFPLILLGVSCSSSFRHPAGPGDAITAMLGTEAGLLTPEQRAALAAYFGIDQPVHVQYWRWLTGLFAGRSRHFGDLRQAGARTSSSSASR